MRRYVVCVVWGMLHLCGCGTTGGVISKNNDSTRVEIVERRVVVRDTITVLIPKEVERVKVLQDSSFLINSYSSSQAIISPDGTLFHSLETLEQELTWPISSDVTVRDSVVYRERVVTQIVERERELSGWQQFQISGFYLLLLAVVALLLLWKFF